MSISSDLIINIAVCIVVLFLINSVTLYMVVRLVVRGPLFQAKAQGQPDHSREDQGRLIHMAER